MKTKIHTLLGAFVRWLIVSRQLANPIVSALALGWLAAPLQAQLIHDPFNYTPGVTLAGQSPFAPLTWYAAGPAGPQQARVQAGVLQWPGLSNSVPNRVNITAGNGPSSLFVFGTMDVADPYPPITGGTIYFSFILRVTDLTGLGVGGNYFAGFTPDQGGGAVTPANVFTRVLLRTSGAGYNIGLDKSSGVLANFQWDTRVFNAGDTVLLVGAYIFSGENADISQLWINPDPTTFCSSTPPLYTLQSTAGVDATQLASVAYIQRPTPAQPTAMLTDELRVSQFWDGVVRPGWDYPDAPGSYHTLFADNAARHTVVPGIYMGTQIDVECNGLPTPLADGDDLNNLDDGDGVTWAAGPWVMGGTKSLIVTVSVNGRLDAFFDWNRNGTFDPGEQVFTSVAVFAGLNPLTVTVPPGAAAGFTYMRFRFSTAGGLGAVGPAPDGEVEDYRIQVQAPPPPDLGLAVLVSPQPVTDTSNVTYSVTVTNKGGDATTTLLTVPLPAGLTFASATASQGSCSNTTNGVQCNLGTLQPGGSATINVVGIPDFNQLATALNIPDTQETIEVSNTVAVTSLEVDAAPADNVAVVVVAVVPLRDFGDAPTPPYPTLLPNGARHRIGVLRFGVLLDAEPNGQPVNLDDAIGVGDEVTDGFGLPAGFYTGGYNPITIQVSGPAAFIDLWIDMNGVPGWDPADQVLAHVAHPGGGAVVGYAIPIPPGTAPGLAWARARVHKNPAGLSPHGYGGDGEVVDFQVNILPAAVDLVAVADPAEIVVTEGDLLTQTITVSNKGPSTASGVTLRVHFPLGATLENLQLSRGTGQMEGTNLVCNLTSLAPNASALVTYTAGTSNIFEGLGDEFWYFCFDTFAAEIDLNPDDNMHHGMVGVVAKRDFGDAPDATVGAAYLYPTRLVDNGARHRVVGPYFGGSPAGVSHRDADPDGMPTLNADGDDLLDANDDEEGIQFLDPIFPGATGVRVRINAPLGGKVDAWLDFNRNGRWSMGAPEQIFTSLPVAAGTFDYTFNVPAGAVVGPTYARFRISSAGGLAFTGYATNGEVQDLTVPILPAIDVQVVTVGDPTVQFSDNNPFLLTLRVANEGSNTASGVQVTATLPANVTAQSASASNGTCQINAGTVTCQFASLAPGQNSLIAVTLIAASDNLPGDDSANLGTLTVTATSTELDLNPADNVIALPAVVLFASDWGDAPVGYPVTLVENGARHRRKAGFFLGAAWDRETGGTHSPLADWDDTHGATPDDEDGVTFTAPVAPGAPAYVTVVASAAGFLDAWFDFNGDGDWADAGEQIFTSLPLAAGANTLTFSVPATATASTLFSRWRFSETGGLPYNGPGGKGEVEDHAVTLAARLDFGDAPEVIPGAPAIVTTYEVTLARDGGRHDVSALRLGNNWDAELNGQPSLNADLDDITGVPDDEDGWTPVPFVAGMMMNLTVYVTGGNGLLDIWVDWDHNYNWDVPEHQVMAFAVAPGANTVPINVPGGIPNGPTYARFRLSTAGSALPSGYAADGEVEDYLVTVNNNGGNPNPVFFAGLEHTASSNATVTVHSNALFISNLGSSGQDGVSIDFKRVPDGAGLRFGSNGFALPGLARFGFAAYGTVSNMPNQFLGTVRFENSNSVVSGFFDVNTELLQSARIEVYNGATLVGTYSVPEDGLLGTFSGDFQLQNASFVAEPGHDAFFDTEMLSLSFTPHSQPSTTVTATHIRMCTENHIHNVDRLVVTGRNLASFTISDEAIHMFGHWQRLLAGARLDTAGNGPPTLRVSNLGSSGEDGIETIIGGGNDIWDVRDEVSLPSRVVQLWEGLRGQWLTRSNSHVRWTVTGRITGSAISYQKIEDLLFSKQEQGTALTVDFTSLGATQAVVEVFNGPTYVSRGTLNGTGLVSFAFQHSGIRSLEFT